MKIYQLHLATLDSSTFRFLQRRQNIFLKGWKRKKLEKNVRKKSLKKVSEKNVEQLFLIDGRRRKQKKESQGSAKAPTE
jgi:hypothetical protein